MEKKQWYYYEVTKPIKDYGRNYEIGDLVGYFDPIRLPAYYKNNCMKLLNSPVYK